MSPIEFDPLRGVDPHLKKMELTDLQVDMLNVVKVRPIFVGDLREDFGVRGSTVRAMERRGYVKRLRDWLSITPEGKEKLEGRANPDKIL